ncbi:MAG: hypothetical protein JSU01_02450 [Bacteroidetes bacterium]|nr:hypothetical protein [Bacteroidota bacterium]
MSIIINLAIWVMTGVQIQTPVHWQYGIKKVGTGKYEIHLKANISNGWHLYAQNQPEDAIAVPAKIAFKKDPAWQLVGKTREVGKLEHYNNSDAGIEANQYEKTVDFVQGIVVTGKLPLIVHCTIEFQTCTDKMCLPAADQSFEVPIH